MRSILVPAGNPGPMTGAGNNTWLLDGRVPTLVDAGVGMTAHVEALAAALGGRPLAQVLVTHHHPDHASGVPALRVRWPGVRVGKLLHPDDRLDELDLLFDGQIVPAGDAELVVVGTPGHALDHACFWDAAAGDLYAGDMLARGTTVMISRAGGGLRAYMASLDRLAALRPRVAYPGHGKVLEDPLGLIARYAAHRRERDAQVRECLRDGLIDPDAIVERLYPYLAPALVHAARETIQAHLDAIGPLG